MNSTFRDHFQNPRRVGEVAEPDGRAEVENPVCGDRIQLTLKLEDGRVSKVAFKVQGCSGSIAAASAMGELAEGRRIVEAHGIDRDAIDAALGGLPTLKRHGADLAAEGLRTALENATSRKGGGAG